MFDELWVSRFVIRGCPDSCPPDSCPSIVRVPIRAGELWVSRLVAGELWVSQLVQPIGANSW